MKRHTILCLLTCAALIWGGCRSHRELGRTTEPTDSIPSTPASGQRTCFAANFQCETDDWSCSGMMRVKEDSIIWVSLSKVVELGRMTLTPDSICIYVRFSQRYYRGDYATLNTYSGYHIDYASIQEILLDAYRNKKPAADLILRSNQQQDTFHLTFTRYSKVREQTYPLHIPDRARPF